MSGIGATSPGRWQDAHFSYTIGATSLAKVGDAGPAAWLVFKPGRRAIRVPTSTKATRFIAPPKKVLQSSLFRRVFGAERDCGRDRGDVESIDRRRFDMEPFDDDGLVAVVREVELADADQLELILP